MCAHNSKWIFLVLLIVFHIPRNEANSDSINLDFFEDVKEDLFQQLNFDPLKHVPNLKSPGKITKCLIEMNAIKNGFKNREQWAFKTVDAWGKIPSGFFSGNFYEFGAFSQCFNIVRDDEKYDTKYCLGNLIFNLTGISSLANYQSNVNNHAIIPNIFEAGNEPGIMPRTALTQPNASRPAITFGMCLPSSCAMDLMESFVNELIKMRVTNVSVQMSETTCQYEENATELTTIDVATLVILAIVLCLIVASTTYDIVLTVCHRSKSQALLAFSFYSNGMKLLSYKKSKSSDMMHCLHGIRAISTQWIILGHTFMTYIWMPVQNKIAIPDFLSKYPNMLIASGTIAVDTFFYMSGLLVSINMLKQLHKTNGKMNIPLLYFHRYLRLTPLLGASFLVSMSLLRFLGNGPLWPSLIDFLSGQCKRNWWSTLLYVQNYVNPLDICFGHSWYLSVDMQLFVISPIIIYLIYWFGAFALPVLGLLVFACVACTISVYLEYNIQSSFKNVNQDKSYYPTHIRFSPWLLGVMAGYVFFVAKKRRLRIPAVLNIFGWAFSLAIMATVVFLNHPLLQLDTKATALQFGLYDALSRVAWSMALSYIIFACINNAGGPVNWFLSHPLWQPISRLCYATYLVHFPVILATTATMKAAPYFTELAAFQAFFGNYIITIFVAIIASLAFESPIVVIEKLIFGPRNKPDSDPRIVQTRTEDTASQPNLSHSNETHVD